MSQAFLCFKEANVGVFFLFFNVYQKKLNLDDFLDNFCEVGLNDERSSFMNLKKGIIVL